VIDVRTEVDIDLPRAEVAEYAGDPDNATSWYENIKSVEWKTSPPLAEGSRIAFVAEFLGKRIEYTYEITAFEPGERLVMSASAEPFPMETTYTWEDTPNGGTQMSLRNRGGPSGIARFAAPLMAFLVRRANRRDLRRLKRDLEGDARRLTVHP
jgi:uncharacterized protein YndB with AHSA1/START domain